MATSIDGTQWTPVPGVLEAEGDSRLPLATTSEANGPLGYTNRTLNQHAIWDSGNYHATLPVVLEY